MRKGSRKIDELALANRKRRATLVRRCGDSFRKRSNEIAQTDFVDGALHVFARDARSAEPNVRFDGAGKEERILQHDSEMTAQILQIEEADVHAIQKNLTRLNFIKAQQQGDKFGFAGAGVAYDCESLAGENP